MGEEVEGSRRDRKEKEKPTDSQGDDADFLFFDTFRFTFDIMVQRMLYAREGVEVEDEKEEKDKKDKKEDPIKKIVLAKLNKGEELTESVQKQYRNSIYGLAPNSRKLLDGLGVLELRSNPSVPIFNSLLENRCIEVSPSDILSFASDGRWGIVKALRTSYPRKGIKFLENDAESSNPESDLSSEEKFWKDLGQLVSATGRSDLIDWFVEKGYLGPGEISTHALFKTQSFYLLKKLLSQLPIPLPRTVIDDVLHYGSPDFFTWALHLRLFGDFSTYTIRYRDQFSPSLLSFLAFVLSFCSFCCCVFLFRFISRYLGLA